MIDRVQRERWAVARQEKGLVPGSADFARHGLAARLDEVGVLAVVLPPDPLACDVEFTDALLDAVLPRTFAGVMQQSISSLNGPFRTADAAYTAAYPPEQPRAYVAVRRDGGTEGAIGSYAFRVNNDNGVRRYWLSMLVHLARQVIDAQRRLLTAPGTTLANGPHELVVALRHAQGAQLGDYAEGWYKPSSLFGDQMPTCAVAEPVVRLDVAEWPTGDAEIEQLVIRAAGRISDTFNDSARRFLVPRGPQAGTLDRGYA